MRKKFFFIRSASFVVAFIALCIASLSFAQKKADPNKYIKLDKGIGNCIFATHELEKDKEAAYTDVREEFKAPEQVHVRCYFAKELQGYESKGKLSNSMRNGVYWQDLSVESVKTTNGFTYKMETKYDKEKEKTWSTRRYDLVLDAKGCDWKYPDAYTDCVDVEKDARELAKADKASLPYTAKVCVQVYMTYADEKKSQWDEYSKSWELKDVVYKTPLSESCFKYTVK